MEELVRNWEGSTLILRHDKPTNAIFIIAIYSIRSGTSGGGTRMKAYENTDLAIEDAFRLSRAMAYKHVISGFEIGGAKAVIALPRDFNENARHGLLLRYGQLVHDLGGLFVTAPDIGTSSSDMDVMAQTGGKHILGQNPERGGFGNSGPITGLGVYVSMKVACQEVFGSPDLKGRKVVVQGAGQVGGSVIKHLLNEGAEVVVNEVNEALAQRVAAEFKVSLVPTKDVYSTECDIFSPCGLGGILNPETIPQLKCKIVAGGANNQLSDREKAAELQQRGILYLPDYVINSGGSIGLVGHAQMGMSHEQVEKRTAERIPEVVEQILSIAKSKNISMEDAALHFVRESLA